MTALIRHIANLGLLLSFLTLAVTGVLSFVLPFSITTARVHIVFGLATVLLVLLHLATRLRYFARIARQSVTLKAGARPTVPRWLVAAIVLGWTGLLAIALRGDAPVAQLIDAGYEARHRAAIFRASPDTVYQKIGPDLRVRSVEPGSGTLVIEARVVYREPLEHQPAAALWAQTTRSRMIQTLFVDQALAYADEPVWNGRPTPRHHVLPIWRHAYTQVNGVDPEGDFDAVTAATPKHSFSVAQALTDADGPVVICLEVNAAGDPNDAYPDEHLGQPSVLYTALIDPDDQQDYYLMARTAHGGGAERDGDPRYSFEQITTAKHLVERVLIHVQRPGAQR